MRQAREQQQFLKLLDENSALSFLRAHYLTLRSKWAIQLDNGAYRTYTKWSLHDDKVKEHIKGKRTLAVYVNKVSKFLAFDIDVYADNIEVVGKHTIRKLVNVLKGVGVPSEAMSLWYSGKKGYHVDIYFNEPVKTEELKKFFDAVILVLKEEYGLEQGVNIEPRGCNGQAYKLPLGIHRVTSRYMSYLNPDTLEQVPYEVPQVEPMEALVFYTIKDEILQRSEVVEATRGAVRANLLAKGIKRPELTEERLQELRERINENKSIVNKVIESNSLLEKGSRNNIIFLVALYCNTTLQSNKDCKELLYSIMENTPQGLFNDVTSIDWKCREVDKVVNKVYKNNWRLKGFEVGAVFTKKELEHILTNCKTLKEMSLYLCFMMYSKQFMNGDGIFFLAQTTIEKETGIEQANSSRMIKKLAGAGLVQIVQKGYYTHVDGVKIGIATNYTIPHLMNCMSYGDSEKIQIKKPTTSALVEAIVSSFTANELKKLVSKNMFYKVFKPLF